MKEVTRREKGIERGKNRGLDILNERGITVEKYIELTTSERESFQFEMWTLIEVLITFHNLIEEAEEDLY